MLQTPNELRKELSPTVMRRLEEIVAAVNQLEQRLAQRVTPVEVTPQQVTEAVRGLIGIYGQRILGDDSAADPQLTEVGTTPGSVSSIAVTNGGDTNVNIAGSPITSSGTITVSLTANPAFVTVDVTTQYNVAGTKVIGAQGALVADAAGGATIDTQARTAINTLLSRLRTHGIIAT